MNGNIQTKINFLQEESKSLEIENQQLRQLLNLNKEIIRTQTKIQSHSKNSKIYQILYKELLEENNSLLKINEEISKQKNQARSEVLINEQIAEGAYQRQIELIQEMEAKMTMHKSILDEKEYYLEQIESRIQEMNIRKKIPIKQSITGTCKQLKLYEKLLLLQNYYRQVQLECKQKKQQEMEKKMLSETNPQVENDDEYDEMSEQYIEVMPEKIQQKKSPTNSTIPKLDLSKAYTIQKLSIKKQEEMDQQEQLKLHENDNLENNPNKLYIQLQHLCIQNRQNQKELMKCRSRLQDEMMNSKMLEDQLDELLRQIENSNSTNDLLIRSQQNYEQQWSRIYDQYTKYEQYYDQQQKQSCNQISKAQFVSKMYQLAYDVYAKTDKNSQMMRSKSLNAQ